MFKKLILIVSLFTLAACNDFDTERDGYEDCKRTHGAAKCRNW